jgi:hypothetical protein
MLFISWLPGRVFFDAAAIDYFRLTAEAGLFSSMPPSAG